jgi:hypothetical protein
VVPEHSTDCHSTEEPQKSLCTTAGPVTPRQSCALWPHQCTTVSVIRSQLGSAMGSTFGVFISRFPIIEVKADERFTGGQVFRVRIHSANHIPASVSATSHQCCIHIPASIGTAKSFCARPCFTLGAPVGAQGLGGGMLGTPVGTEAAGAVAVGPCWM